MTDCYKRHFDQCDKFKGIPDVISPKKGKTFKFNAFYAHEKSPFVSYFDTESVLLLNTDVKKTLLTDMT